MNTLHGTNNLPTPPGSIHEDQTIDEASEFIPVEELERRPHDKVRWVCCLVREEDFDERTWGRISSSPGIHAFSKTESDYRVLLSEDRIKWLRDYNFQFQLDASELVEEEIISAVKAISSGHGLGLDNLLCSLATDWRVRAAIEWAMLERDILGLEPTVFEAFLCRCTLLSVHLTGNLAPGFGRVGVDRPSRAQHFSKLARERIEQRSNDPNAEMQDVALCRGLIRSVLDDESPPHCGLDLSWPANANLKRLPGLLGLDPTAVQFRGFDIYLEDDVNVKSLRNAICHYVPIGFTADIYKALPADLLNDLPYGTVDSALTMMDATFQEFPSLDKPENKLRVFLIHYMSLDGTADPVLCEWALSEEGSSFRRHMLKSMAGGEAVEEKLLLLSSLIWYHKLLPCVAGTQSHPDNDNDATDFKRLLDGEQLRNEGEILDRMAMTFIRVVEHPATRHFLHEAVRDMGRPLLDWLDPLTERYCHQMQWAKHEEAFRTALMEYREWMKRICVKMIGE